MWHDICGICGQSSSNVICVEFTTGCGLITYKSDSRALRLWPACELRFCVLVFWSCAFGFWIGAMLFNFSRVSWHWCLFHWCGSLELLERCVMRLDDVSYKKHTSYNFFIFMSTSWFMSTSCVNATSALSDVTAHHSRFVFFCFLFLLKPLSYKNVFPSNL